MSLLIETGLLLLALVLIVPIIFFIVEMLLSLKKPQPFDLSGLPMPRTTVLVPAHNESQTIAKTLDRLKADLPDNSEILVVADNCTDNTARIAANAGVEVITRHDEHKQAKGYALDFGLQHLKTDPPRVVIIVDADCMVAKGTIARLARMAQKETRPVQASYIMEPHEKGGLMQHISAFAFMINTHHRMIGAQRMGLPVRLNGTGMAFPWDVLEGVELGNDNIVEDIKLGVDLVKAGTPALFCADALVTSRFPQSDEALQTQRTRWEHGHLELLRKVAPGLIWHSLVKRQWSALGFALDLAIPPLTLALFALIIGFGLSAIAALFGLSLLPLILTGLTGFGFLGALALVWHRDGQEILPSYALKNLPLYVLSKIGIYKGYIAGREKAWIRTDRS